MSRIDRLGKRIIRKETKGQDNSKLLDKYSKALEKSGFKKGGYLKKVGKVAPSLLNKCGSSRH